jgi:hypothetical protein
MEFMGFRIQFRNNDGQLAAPTGSDGTYSIDSIEQEVSTRALTLKNDLGYEIVLDGPTVRRIQRWANWTDANPDQVPKDAKLLWFPGSDAELDDPKDVAEVRRACGLEDPEENDPFGQGSPKGESTPESRAFADHVFESMQAKLASQKS